MMDPKVVKEYLGRGLALYCVIFYQSLDEKKVVQFGYAGFSLVRTDFLIESRGGFCAPEDGIRSEILIFVWSGYAGMRWILTFIH